MSRYGSSTTKRTPQFYPLGPNTSETITVSTLKLTICGRAPVVPRAEYLNNQVSRSACCTGPSIRAGDFAEILVADYLEFLSAIGYPVLVIATRTFATNPPRAVIFSVSRSSRMDMIQKVIPLRFLRPNRNSPRTTLRQELQDAVDGSAKDHVRRGESLNALKQRLLDKQNRPEAQRGSRGFKTWRVGRTKRFMEQQRCFQRHRSSRPARCSTY